MADVQPLDPADPEAVQACYTTRGLQPTVRGLLVWYIQHLPPGGPDQQTIRGLWYTALKPALGRAGMLTPSWYTQHGTGAKWQRTEGGINTALSRELSRVLGDLVAEGVTTYSGLAVVDGSRQRRKAQGVWVTLQDVLAVSVNYPHVVLGTEKDTLYPVLAQVAALLGVSAVSGKGQPSAAVAEELARRLAHYVDRGAVDDDTHTMHLLTVTDYDPHGADIAQALARQLQDACTRVGLDGWQVDHHHLGVLPHQVPEVAESVYPVPADAVLPRWVADGHGLGPDGRPYTGRGPVFGLELDALGVRGMRALMVQGVMPVLGRLYLGHMHLDLAEAAIRQAVWARVQPSIERLLDAYTEALGWEVPDGMAVALDAQQRAAAEPWQGPIGRLAMAGRSHIDPLDDAADLWGADRVAELHQQVAEAEANVTPVTLPPTE